MRLSRNVCIKQFDLQYSLKYCFPKTFILALKYIVCEYFYYYALYKSIKIKYFDFDRI